ncbi:hypothetical protein [Catenulispora subtropica]|uniref:Glycoside hydrolase family 5 domain-containing protein n=1 Tax=Catenulispora subtropica TaxID=450798 RepID=A0ABP5BT76_9ACTN
MKLLRLPDLRQPALGLASAAALVVGVVTTAPSVHAAGATLAVVFYDATGSAMTGQAAYDLMRNKADNLTNQYAQKIVTAFVNPATLEDVNPGNTPLMPTVNADSLSFPLPAGTPAGLAVTWATSGSRGYSQVVLDNGGAGYVADTTVNFTYQAALDLKRRFDAAVTTRTTAIPAYIPSAAFTNAQNQLAADYATMTGATTDAARGRAGWPVLADLHAAYDILLTEYGPQLAKYKDEHNQGSPWFGTTFDAATNADTSARLGDAANATQPTGVVNPGYGWVRIVFDVGTQPSDYDNAVISAHNQGLQVMGMPFDSTTARACLPETQPTHCTPAEYQARFAGIVDHFSNRADNPKLNIDAWEVGNEINGEWIDTDPVTHAYVYGSGQMAVKIANAADYVHTHTAAPAVGTLYWQVATSNYPLNSTFTWARNNLTAGGVGAKLDAVLLSTYIEDAPMGTGLDQAMNALVALFPTKQIGLGEFDYFYTNTSRYFWALTHLNTSSTQAQAQAARPTLATQYYSEALGYQTSVGGMFWWYFQEESPGTAGSDLQAAVKAVANKVYFG